MGVGYKRIPATISDTQPLLPPKAIRSTVVMRELSDTRIGEDIYSIDGSLGEYSGCKEIVDQLLGFSESYTFVAVVEHSVESADEWVAHNLEILTRLLHAE